MIDVADLKRQYGKHGWFISVATQGERRDGIWPDYDTCYRELRESAPNNYKSSWRGQHVGSPSPPRAGEGFALYYNSRNPSAFKKRVVLIGRLAMVEWDASQPSTEREHQFEWEYSAEVLNVLERDALHNTKSNEHIFTGSLIKPGVVATFYHIAPRPWDALLGELSTKL